MLSNPSDREVIERVLAGDTEAFGLLVDRYQDGLAAYAKYMTGSVDEAEDIVQESFVRAFKALRQCRDPDRCGSWLFRIVSNQCKTHLARRRTRKEEPLASAAQAAHFGGTEEPAEAEELRRKVHEALQRISPDQREALVLRYVHGMSLSEMTELLARVDLVGDWTGWEPVPMERAPDGSWIARVRLQPGVYRFNLIVNGETWIVPHNAVAIEDGYGGKTGLLIVAR